MYIYEKCPDDAKKNMRRFDLYMIWAEKEKAECSGATPGMA